MKNVRFPGPTSKATSRTKNRAISAAITMVLHSLAAVLLWVNVVVLAAVVVFVVGVQGKSCWLALLAAGAWVIINFLQQQPTNKKQDWDWTSGMFFGLGLVAFLVGFWGPF